MVEVGFTNLFKGGLPETAGRDAGARYLVTLGRVESTGDDGVKTRGC